MRNVKLYSEMKEIVITDRIMAENSILEEGDFML